MKPRSIEEMWQDYSIAAGLQAEGVTPELVEEARRAFFGGLLDMFGALNQISELTEQEADATLEQWHGEFTAYANELSVKLDPEK